jgi:flagellar hook protein FlgE
MAIISSLYTGVSGLSANGIAMSIIGDNIANVNTVGFKASRASFGDILSQNLTGASGTFQIGRGAMLTGVSPVFTQGSFQTTDSGLDMAIDGDGFFIVKDGNGASFYTRAGQFSVDRDGYLVNPEGYRIQGYGASLSGTITGAVGDISLSSSFIAPVASTQATITANLDAAESIPAGAFDPNDSTTYNFGTGITLYDSLGNGHTENVYFVKTAAGWDVYAPGSTSGMAAIGSLTFDAGGNLTAGGSMDAEFDYTASGAGVIGGPGSGFFDFSSATQYASASTVLSQSQNGYASGSLRSVSADQNGLLTGLFSNGMTRPIGQIALANFQNPAGLTKYGRNLYAANLDSGQATVGAPGSGGYGRVLSNSLELSNVDLAREFVDMITVQRGFQANSRVVTTSDEMLADLINLKR